MSNNGGAADVGSYVTGGSGGLILNQSMSLPGGGSTSGSSTITSSTTSSGGGSFSSTTTYTSGCTNCTVSGVTYNGQTGDAYALARSAAIGGNATGGSSNGVFGSAASPMLDKVQNFLGVAGLAAQGPLEPAGVFIDLFDASISALRGNWAEAAVSAGSAVPFIGAVGNIAKVGGRAWDGVATASEGQKVLVLGRRSGLEQIAKEEGGWLSQTASTSARDIYKQNSRDIRSADRIFFNEKNVPNSLEEALQLGGGQFSRAERDLILSRPEILEKTIFINR